MRILATLIFLFLVSGCARGVDASDSLLLRTGGSIFSAAFKVELSASGQLHVGKTATPNSRAKSFNRKLNAAQTQEILLLASKSNDFVLGCGKVADGTSAGMKIIYHGIDRSFSCQGSPDWPRGAATSKLLSAINRYLPTDLQVF